LPYREAISISNCSCLVTLPIPRSRRNTNLIHQPKDNLRVICKSPSKFSPECTKLGSCRRFRIASAPDDAPGRWLLGGIVIPHVVVRIQDCVCSFCDGDVVDGIGKVPEMLFCVNGARNRRGRGEARTVSSNLDPRPVASGHMRSRRKATRKRFAFHGQYPSVPSVIQADVTLFWST
jgi:hypothetical protein